MTAVSVGAGTPETALDRERRLRPRFAALAVAAAVLLMAASIVQMIGPHTKVDEATLDLIYASKRTGLDILASLVSAAGSIVIALTLLFLLRAAKARNEQVPPFIRIVTIAGAAIAAIAGVVYAIVISSKAHTFATTGQQTYAEAHQLTSSGALVALQIAGLLGALLVAMAIVLVSLQAMRVGLLTRFMGYLGMFAGALVLFQITPVPIVEAYWFIALAVLFAGRWPSGEPLAWQTGRAEKWPSSQELREQRIRAANDRKGGGKPARGPAARLAAKAAAGREGADTSNGTSPPDSGDAGATAAGTATAEKPARPAGAASAKRKRKRKR
jgi:glucan phosphoethanolaminetransferase (alkaline phosphatase superfamily)